MFVDLGFLGVSFEDQPESLPGEPRAAMIDEQRRLVRVRQRWAAVLQIVVDRLDRLWPQRNLPAAGPPFRTSNLVDVEIDVVGIERDQLAYPHARGIKRFDHRQIPERVRPADFAAFRGWASSRSTSCSEIARGT